MKKLALLAALAALAACSREADDTAATDDTTAEAPMPAETTAAVATPGTYDVKLADGTTVTSTLNADGTYVDVDASGAETERGTWAVKDGKSCFDPDGDAAEICFTDGPAAADGSWVATADDGTTVTVTRRVEATPAG